MAGYGIIGCDYGSEHHVPDNYHTWTIYRGDPGSNAYSGLAEINKENAGFLELAWTYSAKDDSVSSSRASIQCNPIIVDDILYGTSATLKVFALDAATGRQIWQYDPADINTFQRVTGNNRGLTYWERGDDKRLFYAVQHKLVAINANTGKLISGFGEEGMVDLRVGLDREFDEDAYITNTSPGVIYQDLIIMGSSVHESYGSLPGHIRAYNVLSGEIEWIFHTIPYPGEYGYDTWPEQYYKTGGGANAWGGFSIDVERGVVYTATGSATHDFYGADRLGLGLFSNSVLALEAATGKYKWHFQVSHHDVWDYDLPTAPNLVTINKGGEEIEAVVQLTKQGLVFVLDRETGEPLLEVEERPVPQSEVGGENTWPTQPFPLKPPPLVRQKFDISMVTDISKEATTSVMDQIQGFTLGEIYSPPSLNGTVQLPGFRGGAEWSGGAFDPESGIIYVGVNDIPNLVQLTEHTSQNQKTISEFDQIIDFGESVYQSNCAACHGQDLEGSISYPSLTHLRDSFSLKEVKALLNSGRGMMPSFAQLPESDRGAVLAFLFKLGNEEAMKLISLEKKPMLNPKPQDLSRKYRLKAYNQLRDNFGYPGIKPPWGSLCAVNLNTGEIVWKVPLGEYQELTKKGIPPTGTQLFGGAIVTAGGLVFIGASRDEKFRALDKETGEVLWEFQLPAGGYATPATYQVNGVQYVVIAAGGGGFQGTKLGDQYLAFTLPKDSRL